MNLLALDTSTKNLSLAVSKGEKVLRFRNVRLRRPLSSSIMPSIEKILDDAKVPLNKLDGFAIGLGPGSFTSLRVGLSTVKGLAFATGKLVVGVPSLDVLAMNVPGDHEQICTIVDAKRKLVYACLFQRKGAALKKTRDYCLTDIRDVLKGLKGRIAFIGDGIPLFKQDITERKSIVPEFVDQKQAFPQAKCLVPLALQKFQKGKTDDIDKLIPLYLYPDDCQIRK